MSQIKNSIVLITGGASGIGRLMARESARMGARVVVWDIDSKGLEEIKNAFKEEGLNLTTYTCDLSRRENIYETAEKVKKEVGPPDILVNNAGVVSGKPFLECTDEQIENTMAVNAMAYLWTTKAFLPDMIQKNSGHIVNISSAGGTIGVARLADYSMSKFAVFGFNEALRNEFRKQKQNIRTTIVCPYYINTGMFDGVKTRFSFILPILDQHKVTRRIIRAIRKNKPRLLMPWIVYTVPLLRLLPVSWFDAIAALLGISSTMDEFTGRNRK